MKMPVYRYPDQDAEIAERLSSRTNLFDRGLLSSVAEIFEAVEAKGDEAVLEATERFDGVGLTETVVDKVFVRSCVDGLSPQLRRAISVASGTIRQFNEKIRPKPMWTTDIRPGTSVGEKATPLDSVGLWIPSRKGPLVSTALMLVNAAVVAGVRNIIVGLPPAANGLPDEGTVAAAAEAGATSFVCGNGVAIIAAFAIGTASVPKVTGVFGPGPGGVAAAMSIAFSYGVRTVLGIGPTDSLILADESADAEILAHDLLNEAEHGPDSSSVLVTHSEKLSDEVGKQAGKLMSKHPEKESILDHSFGPSGLSGIVLTDSVGDSIRFANDYAPEHMIVNVAADRESYVVERIESCGELLLGDFTPFSAGNYAIGITAVLPTNGFARNVSGVTCRDMMKTTTIGRLSRDALIELRPTIEALGRHEGLPYHVDAALARETIRRPS